MWIKGKFVFIGAPSRSEQRVIYLQNMYDVIQNFKNDMRNSQCKLKKGFWFFSKKWLIWLMPLSFVPVQGAFLFRRLYPIIEYDILIFNINISNPNINVVTK
jgi:hypothetical protein